MLQASCAGGIGNEGSSGDWAGGQQQQQQGRAAAADQRTIRLGHRLGASSQVLGGSIPGGYEFHAVKWLRQVDATCSTSCRSSPCMH
eukprot:scaffold270678_cov13-Tisochrysis_lutea.AAC.1